MAAYVHGWKAEVAASKQAGQIPCVALWRIYYQRAPAIVSMPMQLDTLVLSLSYTVRAPRSLLQPPRAGTGNWQIYMYMYKWYKYVYDSDRKLA